MIGWAFLGGAILGVVAVYLGIWNYNRKNRKAAVLWEEYLNLVLGKDE